MHLTISTLAQNCCLEKIGLSLENMRGYCIGVSHDPIDSNGIFIGSIVFEKQPIKVWYFIALRTLKRQHR